MCNMPKISDKPRLLSKRKVVSFLADRTIGRAFGTLCRLSSVTLCIVAKWYVLAKNCPKE